MISFVGYESWHKTIQVTDKTPQMLVNLQKTEDRLDEITVTALGLARKTRSLTYATQKVSGEEFSTVKNTNILNSLNGKVSGVQVNRTSGGAGGSVRVVLRGDKSTRNSQPLYVLDGLPLVNPTGGPVAGLYNDAPDAGDIISSINPDDIESVSILKGAAASALYGSQGSNGVVLITTRGSNAGAARINLSSSFTTEQPILFPETQSNYGQSTMGNTSSPGSEDSWGAKGTTLPGSNYMKDFFKPAPPLSMASALQEAHQKIPSIYHIPIPAIKASCPAAPSNNIHLVTGKQVNSCMINSWWMPASWAASSKHTTGSPRHLF